MKRTIAIVLVALSLAGCVGIYPTIIVKRVTIEKNAAGEVQRILEEESVTQQSGRMIMKLEHIKIEEPPPSIHSAFETQKNSP